MKKILPRDILESAFCDAIKLHKLFPKDKLTPPPYSPLSYYKDVARYPYFDALIILRHHLKIASDVYFSRIVGAKNVDLFMMTPSVSSPMGPGSDSEAIPLTFGKLRTYLVDSSQFGFEPLLFQGLDKVYCYLPSMRGEDPDERHLNQFFHCELEMIGTLEQLLPIVEGYVRALSEMLLALDPIVKKMSKDYNVTHDALLKIASSTSFKRLSFDESVDLLQKTQKNREYIKTTKNGRSLTSDGEKMLTKIIGGSSPLWVTGYDRDTVPFYQKPDKQSPSKVINADLIFPQLIRNSFGGEIIGAGQRQDNKKEMKESLKRQGIDATPYQWYMELRSLPGYRTTSGFGLGVERFIAWALGYQNIRDVIPYPRLKNIKTLP